MRFRVVLALSILIAILFETSFFLDVPDSVYRLDDKTIQSAIQYMNLSFIENHGQVDNKIKYYAKTFAGTVYVTDSDLIYQTIKNQDDLRTTLIINEKFLGNPLRPQGTMKSESTVSYFKGSQEDWNTNIPTYDYVSLGQVWDNVNVDLRAYGNNMEKVFTVRPGGNPSDIKMSFEGISDLSVSNEDELAVNTDLGYAFLSKPIGYQFINGKKHDVQVKYAVFDSNTYGFSVLSYDPRFDLVIDPLISSTFIGGTGDDAGIDITRDSSGNVYVTGRTADDTTDFPTTAGVYDTTHNGSNDVFVSKFNTALTTLSASTFIGGSSTDNGIDIAIDSSGNIYITGVTTDHTTDFPTTLGAYNTTHNGSDDVFVSKFNNSLTSLLASTLIGGSGSDYGNNLALDSSGNIYITGVTTDHTTDFPTTLGAYNTTHNGSDDVFVSKFNTSLTTLSASTLIGASGNDVAIGLALDSSGNIYITGKTQDVAVDFPTTAGVYDTTHNGSDDVFVSKFNTSLTTLSASTLIGASGNDEGNWIVLDSSGNIYITGKTQDVAVDFPTTAGVYDTTHNGSDDVFVSKFNNSLTSLLASTLIGGSGNDVGWGIVLDSTNSAYITGETNSTTNFPVTSGAYDTTHNGSYDVFVSKFNSALSTLSASTLIGASGNDYGYMIALDGAGNAYITGSTEDVASDFPVTSGAYDTTHSTGTDAFVSNLDCNLASSSSTCTATVSSGSNTTVSVGSGGTARVETPSGSTLSVTLPSGVSGSISFTDTNSGTSASSITFLGSIIEINPISGASCSGGCTISFTFTGAQAANAGLAPSEVVIYHDSSGNESFETNERLVTTITGSDPYTATAGASFTSKFAVGGVRANAVAAAQSLSAGGFFDFLSSCDPDGFAKGKSLKVYEVSYDKCESNKLQIIAYSTCGPMIAQVTTGSGIYTLGMSSTQPFLNDKEKKLILGAELSPELKSLNLMLKDKRDSFTDKIYLNQCSDTKKYSYQTGYTSEQQNPFFYDSYDSVEEIKQHNALTDPESNHKQNVFVDPEPTKITQSAVMLDPESNHKQNVFVDPEPTKITQSAVMLDPEPIDKNSKNGFIEVLIKTFSKIFYR